MQNRNRFYAFKDSIKKIAVKLEAISNEMARAIKERQRLECLKRRRQADVEQLRATVFIKVFDELLEGKPHYPDPQRRDSEVICRLVYDPAYRRAVNSIQRAEIKLSRLRAQEQVFQAQTGRLQIEEKLLIMEIEQNATTDKHRYT
ncbi:MAG: hypothetical protein V1701_10145 [Planctomycetota bacterium]